MPTVFQMHEPVASEQWIERQWIDQYGRSIDGDTWKLHCDNVLDDNNEI